MKRTNGKTTVFTYGRPGDLYSHVKQGWLDDRDLSAEALKITGNAGDKVITVLSAEMFRDGVRMSSRNLL